MTNVTGSVGVTPNTRPDSSRPSADGANQPNRQADQTEAEPLAQNHPQDIAALCAHCNADADFAHAGRDRISNEAVNADGRQQHRDQRKRDQQRRLETPLRLKSTERRLERRHAVHRRALLDLTNGGLHRSHHPHGIGGCFDEQHDETRRILRQRLEHLWNGLLFRSLPPHVADDADDGKPGTVRIRGPELEAPADGILPRPQAARHHLVDDGRFRSVGAIRGCNRPPSEQRRADAFRKTPD